MSTLGNRILEKWNIKLFSTYASTEMQGGFTECMHGRGGHHHPELLITEFIDDNGNPVYEGEEGELVITTMGVEGMPLLRFKTGDICSYYAEPCKCGRTSIRIGPVVGRKKHMIKYKGTTFYPPALYELLNDFKEISSYLIEVTTNKIGTDEIILHIASEIVPEGLEESIKEHFRAKIRVSPKIHFETKEVLHKKQFPETSRKAINFIDNRNIKKE
jgi:phenylacetate-CoA ligase